MLSLYRGVNEPISPHGDTLFIREDRRPRDTGDKVIFNVCFNLMIERHFGVPLIRRRSLFVTGDISQAIKYAKEPTACFVGEIQLNEPFRFIYAPNVVDSAALVADLTDRYIQCFHAWQLPRCGQLLEDPLLTLDRAEAFFSSTPDIDVGGFAWSKLGLRERIYTMLDGLHHSATRRSYPYTDLNIAEALRTGAEVLVFDAPAGYLIRRVNEEHLTKAILAKRSVN